MIDNIRPQAPSMTPGTTWPQAPSARETSKMEVLSATGITLSLVKAANGLRMYPPNSPFLKKFIHELLNKMQKHHHQFGEFRLDIEQFAFRYKGDTVYENQDPAECIAFRMHADGIRSIIFGDGVEAQELCDFLNIINLSSPGDIDDDIVTRMWNLAPAHLSFILADDFQEVERQAEEPVHCGQQDQIRLLYESLPPLITPHLPTIPLHLHALSAEEAKMLRADREADEMLDPVNEVTDILSAILTGVTEPKLFGAFVEITIKLAGNALASSEMGVALRLLDILHRVANSTNVSSEICGIAARALGGFLTDNTIISLRKTIDTTEAITSRELSALLLMLGKDSLGGICELLGQVQRMKMRKAVLEVLIQLGKGEPHLFIPLLADSRWYLVRNVVVILTTLKDPDMLEPVASLISHRDQRVRKEVLTFLEQLTEPKAKTYLLRFLRDESRALRIRTLQILRQSGLSFALGAISSMVDREGFDGIDLGEKKVIFEAIGELGQEKMFPLFRTMLLKKHWFNKAKRKESVMCAIAGLQKIGGENAAKILEEGLRWDDSEVSDLILQASAAIRADIGATAGGRG